MQLAYLSLLNAKIYPKMCAALSVSNLELNYWDNKKLLQIFPKIECRYVTKKWAALSVSKFGKFLSKEQYEG